MYFVSNAMLALKLYAAICSVSNLCIMKCCLLLDLLFDKIPLPELRRQDEKNRQNSIDDLDPFEVQNLELLMQTLFDSCMALYEQMLKRGVAKECARMVLPLCTPTKIYMSGSVRSWIHYIDLRSANGTQKEHMDLANACKDIFVEQFPEVSVAMEWKEQEEN